MNLYYYITLFVVFIPILFCIVYSLNKQLNDRFSFLNYKLFGAITMRVEAKITEIEETTHSDPETKKVSLAYNVYMRLTQENKAMSQITAILKSEHVEAGLAYTFESLVGKIVCVNLGLMFSDRGGRIWFFPSMAQFGGPNPVLSINQPKLLSSLTKFDDDVKPADTILADVSDFPPPKETKPKDSTWLKN